MTVRLTRPNRVACLWPAARRMGPAAQHRTRQLPAATPAGTVVPPAPGHRHRHQLRRPHRRQPRRAHRLGAPASPALRPGPHRQVPRRRRILPRLRSPLLPPALALIRHRIRLLPLRTWQRPGPAVVAVSDHASDSLDRSSYLARHPFGAFTVPELTGRARTAGDLSQSEGTIRSATIAAVASERAQDLTLRPAAGKELSATGALPPSRFHCSARVTFGPLLV